MKKFDKRAKKEIIDYLRGTKDRIEVKPGKCRYNFRCQYNAVHEAIEQKQKRIAMAMYIDEGYPIIHFLNVDRRGKFIDNTLGHWSTQNEYFFIKYIDEVDYFKVDSIFTSYRKELQRKLTFFTRLFSDIQF